MRRKKTPVKLTNCNYKAQLWCFNNDYKIYAVLALGGYTISIDNAHKHYDIKEVHKAADIDQAIWNLYETIYNKKNNKENNKENNK